MSRHKGYEACIGFKWGGISVSFKPQIVRDPQGLAGKTEGTPQILENDYVY